LESICVPAAAAPGLPYASDAGFGPAAPVCTPGTPVATVLLTAETVVRINASIESTRYCGVCTPMG
jgi:hypothetical protein